jgi:hypothetical protein
MSIEPEKQSLCTHCNNPIWGNPAVCPHCGKSVAEFEIDPALLQAKITARQILSEGKINNQDLYLKTCIKLKKKVSDDGEATQLLGQLKDLEKMFWVWWLLPLFLFIIGGIIGWMILEQNSPQKSKDLLTFGWVMTGVWGLVSIISFMVIPPW